MLNDFVIAILVLVIAGLVALDIVFLRWLRRRNHKFDLTPNDFLPSGRQNKNYPNSDTPPCWPYGWPGEE